MWLISHRAATASGFGALDCAGLSSSKVTQSIPDKQGSADIRVRIRPLLLAKRPHADVGTAPKDVR